jgi:hypothetical protein
VYRLSKHTMLPLVMMALLVITSLACSVLSPGGGQGQPTQPPPASQKATAPAEQPAPTGALKECLDSFPTYPSVKPDAELGQYMGKVFRAWGFQSIGLGYITRDSPEQVTEFYQMEAPKQGWEPAPIQGDFMMWGKEDKYLVGLLVTKGDDDKGAKIGVVCTVDTQ